MSALIASPFDLAFDELVEARVSAVNGINQNVPREAADAAARIRVIPGKAFAPTEGAATSQTQIQIDW